MYFRHGVRSRRLAEYLAENAGVSVERLLEVIAARKRYRRALAERRRRRRRFLAVNPKAESRPREGVVFTGEGELHALLREAGMTIEEFAAAADIGKSTVKGWFGHPMRRTSIILLEHMIWARNMARFLEERGWSSEQFKPKGLPRTTDGRYARTTEQGEAILAAAQPDTIVCPVHGRQTPLGGECPKC